MPQVQITLDSECAAKLDAAAAASSLSREEALKEAIEQYIAYDRWFRAKVEEGERAWREGRYHSHEEVKERSRARLEKLLEARKVAV